MVTIIFYKTGCYYNIFENYVIFKKYTLVVTNSASVAPSDRHQREPSPEY